MENFIFNCYKKWLQQKDGNLFKQAFKIPVKARVLIAFLLASLAVFFVEICCLENGKDNITFAVISGATYIILCIILSIYTSRYQVENSKISLENYKTYCTEMTNSVLTENRISEEFIPELIKRFSLMSNEIDEKIKKKSEYVGKFMEMLLIPSAVLLLGDLLDKCIDTVETVALGVSGILIILLIYATVIFASLLYDIVMRLPQGKYKEFVKDLQSILDYKKYFKEQDESNKNAAPSETSQEVSNAIT